MSSKHQQVVVGYDFSPLGTLVLARAVALASRAPSHILHFVTVIDPHAGVPALPHEGKVDFRYADQIRELISEEVRKAFGGAQVAAEIQFFVHARIGKPAPEILDLAEEVGADLIMVGTHGFTGLERLVMGSTAARIVREAGCPVLVVRAKRYPEIELDTMTEVESHAQRSRPYRFSYTNNNVIMRPPEWPIS